MFKDPNSNDPLPKVWDESTRIGDYDYQLPRVAADVVYLWPEVREVEVRPYPYYDPYWGPRWGRWGW